MNKLTASVLILIFFFYSCQFAKENDGSFSFVLLKKKKFILHDQYTGLPSLLPFPHTSRHGSGTLSVQHVFSCSPPPSSSVYVKAVVSINPINRSFSCPQVMSLVTMT